MNYNVQAHVPHELAEDKITQCLSLIMKGGAVDSAFAARHFRQARSVAVVCTGKEIVGVGVIKQPRPSYASEIARNSEFPFDKNMLELGYVAHEPSHRGHDLSEKIVSKLLSTLPDVPLFATTSNEKMKETLKAAGFVQRGKEWLGKEKNLLSLWIK